MVDVGANIVSQTGLRRPLASAILHSASPARNGLEPNNKNAIKSNKFKHDRSVLIKNFSKWTQQRTKERRPPTQEEQLNNKKFVRFEWK